jgi:hypothetical protein
MFNIENADLVAGEWGVGSREWILQKKSPPKRGDFG